MVHLIQNVIIHKVLIKTQFNLF